MSSKKSELCDKPGQFVFCQDRNPASEHGLSASPDMKVWTLADSECLLTATGESDMLNITKAGYRR